MTSVLSQLLGCGPVWYWIRMWWATARGGNLLVCTVHCSASFMHLFLRVSSLALECHSRWVRYVAAGKYGYEVLEKVWAGESFVAGSGVFQYRSMAVLKCYRASVFRRPCGSLLLVMSHLTVSTPISALQFETTVFEELTCGGCGELRRTTVLCTLIWNPKCSKYDSASACSMNIWQPQHGSCYPCSGKNQQICNGRDMLAGEEGRLEH